MSQSRHQDPESGNLNDADAGDYPDRPQSARSLSLLPSRHDLESGNGSDVRPYLPHSGSILPQHSESLPNEADDRDGSLPLYAMYSKITQELDNREVEHTQQSIDGLLVFTGLFSATVAALLSVTIPDLKPNSQDTSAFYLGNIYEIFANPNGSNGSIPSTLAKPPPFSPPRYVVWVNSLWLLALLMNLSGALIMMLAKDFDFRYISVAHNGDYSPEMRARVRATIAKTDGIGFRDGSVLPFCLHLSLFLFMAGLLVYIFNINHATFSALIWWVAITAVVYVVVTIMPFPDHTLWHTPFSPLVLRLYLVFAYAASQVCSWIKPLHRLSIRTGVQYRELSKRYSEGFIEGRMKSLEEAASKPSSDIDVAVLEHMLVILEEDDALESFFDAIPGFCDSKLVQKPLNVRVTTKLQRSLDGFLDRTFSSQLVTESARSNRVIICLNAAYSALGPSAVSQIIGNIFNGRMDEALESVELGYSLIRWGHSSDNLIYPNVRRIVACIISRTQDRNDHWAILVKKVFGVPEDVIRDHLAHRDSMLLAILLHVAREALDTGRLEQGILESLSQIDIRNTLAELQHDFCALWNEIVQEARNKGFGSTPTEILARIRHLFITLHQGTNAVPNQLPASLDSIVLSQPSSYPLCNIPSHHPDSATQGLALATPTILPPPLTFRRLSEPAIGLSVVQRFQSSSPKLRRTQSCYNFPTVPLSTQPSYPPKSSPSPVLVSPLPLADSPDVVTKDAMPDFADISVITGTADPIDGSTSGSGPTLQQVEETRKSPPSVALGSLPTPLSTPALSHSAISAMLPSSIDPATSQTHFPPGAPSLTTMPLSSTQRITTLSNQRPSPGRAREQDDIQDSRPLTPRTDYRRLPPGGATVL